MTSLPFGLPSIEAVPDAELDRMVDRAWRESVRNWAEVRSCSSSIAAVLRRVALESDGFWALLKAEQDRRRALAAA